MERDVQWKPLPEDLEERLALQGRGEPFVEIQIAICEPGERKVRLGEMESVGAKAAGATALRPALKPRQQAGTERASPTCSTNAF